MLKSLILAAALAAGAPENPSPTHPNEEAVEPYAQSNANAGTTPFEGEAMLNAFKGREGIDRIVDHLVDQSLADPRISEIFKAHDMVRLRRTLKEQFCYILNGGCDYSGRDMKAAHKDMGLQNTDFNALVEHLQTAMDREGVPFRAQNRFLAKLAPMQRDTVER
jgi:hemoglobin